MTTEDPFATNLGGGGNAAQLDKAASVASPGPPEIQPPANLTMTLPRGLQGPGGGTLAEFRELNGYDEEVISKHEQHHRAVEATLVLGVSRIGDTVLTDKTFVERQEILRRLMVGERDILMAGVLAATYGDTKTIAYECVSCEVKAETDLSILKDVVGEVAPYSPPGNYTTKTGDVLALRSVNGFDQAEVLNRMENATIPENNSFLLARAIESRNGGPLVDPDDYVRSLGISDRQKILNIVHESQPKLADSFDVECPSCSTQFRLGVPSDTWFRI